MNRTMLVAATLAGAVTLGACSETAMEPMGPEMIQVAENRGNKPDFAGSNAAPRKGLQPIATVASEGGFDLLVAALIYVDENEGTDLVGLFSEGTDQYTVFAPTNEAFAGLLAVLNDDLGFDFQALTDIPSGIVLDVLLYHVVEGRRAANSVVPRNGERTMTSQLGEEFFVRTDGSIRDGLTGSGFGADAEITDANISASNGIIHEIDQVIVPPSVVRTLVDLAGL